MILHLSELRNVNFGHLGLYSLYLGLILYLECLYTAKERIFKLEIVFLDFIVRSPDDLGSGDDEYS